ncbi:hypothetical protein EQ718_10185 [Paracoccus versutus]|uniref:Uncharacterized protein n=1 Tax=Paracoccus versutus TaxID=34007 RepID=A0AAQ0HD98_PARVE|nr:hypothetical protein [Paracoccus versutus]KGJ03862.1 hypothetical protein IT40_24410 [Paracoccus versutus]REG28342.1 hypothetical protein ATH84_10636 [Paracoccus versutus]WEJ79213.1 hypothetical protein EQ718_10185 [Paracoccus versutus]
MRTRIEKLGDKLHQELGRIYDYCSSADNQGTLMIAWEAALDADVRITSAITRLALGEILYLVCDQRKEEMFMVMVRDCVDDHIWAEEVSDRLGPMEPVHDISPSS